MECPSQWPDEFCFYFPCDNSWQLRKPAIFGLMFSTITKFIPLNEKSSKRYLDLPVEQVWTIRYNERPYESYDNIHLSTYVQIKRLKRADDRIRMEDYRNQ